jgi:hypothetical protein
MFVLLIFGFVFRSLKKRPRRVLSEDGRHVLNIWFLPHYTELLTAYKRLDHDTLNRGTAADSDNGNGDKTDRCKRALHHHLSIASALHDMLQYLCAYARLGLGGQGNRGGAPGVSADWGGTEGIAAELNSIQKQIDNLSNKTCPKEVSSTKQ